MQPRTLEQIYGEIDNVYNPQINSLRQRQSLIPESVNADIKEAEGAQTQAYTNILNGARRRGTGVAFGGIPLGEQAQYASNVFAPSVLRAKTAGRERAMSLEDAILGINERRMAQGQSIFQNEQSMFEQRRQFDAQQALAREQMAAQQREAAASRAAVTQDQIPADATPQDAGATQPDQVKQQAFSDVGSLLSRIGTRSYLEEVQAIAKSAAKGNTYDQAKLELIQVRQPGLFNNGALNTRRINQLWNTYSR